MLGDINPTGIYTKSQILKILHKNNRWLNDLRYKSRQRGIEPPMGVGEDGICTGRLILDWLDKLSIKPLTEGEKNKDRFSPGIEDAVKDL